MILKTQILTFIVSVLFGFLFSIFLDVIKKFLFKMNVIWQFVISLIFVIILSFIYFLVLLKINNAIIHPYYIIAFIIGFCIEIIFRKIFKRIVLLLKK